MPQYDPYSKDAYSDYEKQLAEEAKDNASFRNTIADYAINLKNKILGTPEQNEQARKSLDKIAKGEGMQSDIERGIRNVVGRKKGGKVQAHDWHGFKGGKTGKNKHGF